MLPLLSPTVRPGLTCGPKLCSLHTKRCPARPAAAAANNSPWGSSSGSRKGSSKSGGPNSKSKKGKDSSSDAKKKPKSSTSGVGFAPKAQAPPEEPVYRVTPPLTAQLLDELSPWETAAAPLWGTFTGHCEGEWLGQYAAYTPWGGDPEPVWADESGAYLTHAFSRVSEERRSVPADADTSSDDETSSSSSSGGTSNSSSSSVAAGSLQDQQGEQQQQQQQQQQAGDMLDLLVRSTQRSASISSLIGGVTPQAAAAAATVATVAAADASSSAPAADVAEDDDLEAIACNVNGSVIFNGGSYSLGPEVIAIPDTDEETKAEFYDALEAAAAAGDADGASAFPAGGSDGDEQQEQLDPLSVLPFSLVVVEQALVAAGDRRLRLVATLKLRRPPGQELDIEVARLLLYREFWYGTADSTGKGSGSSGSSSGKWLSLLPSHSFDVPVTELPRPQPNELSGTWNVFVVAANPAVEENPNTLQDETVVLYSSKEERQHWHVPTVTSAAAPSAGSSSSNGSSSDGSQPENRGEAVEDADDSGSSFWLPGGAIVTLRMVPSKGGAGSADGNGSSSKSSKGRPHRGLLIGLHMLDGAGSCLFVEREYDAAGELFEVRQGTAVKGGWSGGRM